MADPFTALGTASSIITFVEFTWKLLTNTHTIYKSATGETEDSTTLSIIAKDVASLGAAIIASPGCEYELQILVKEAQSIAHDLLEALNKLKGQGAKTVWKSFVVALKEVWQGSQVEAFSQRLTKFQTQIALHIQMSILSHVSEISRTTTQSKHIDQTLGTTMQTEFRELREDVVAAVAAVAKLVPRDSVFEPAGKHLKSQNDINIEDEGLIREVLANLRILSEKILHLHETGKRTHDDERVLRSLYFAGIMARQKKIAEAHARTFAWVFQKRPPEFVNWLEDSSGIFWIRGKPGSGKSTLMKFISSHDSTRLHLQPWARGQELAAASFFFWNSGSPLQKSQEGLFRSLLFGILRKYPHLVPRVSALRIELRDDWDNDWSWTVDELLFVCRKIIEECIHTKFCFFVDGMDEYEAEKEDLSDLVKNIRSLASLPNIKLCVSSRPWSVFEDAFGQNPELSLKVEDLTRDDIRQYVSDKFEENRQFSLLRAAEPTTQELVEEICQRAKGVFLWVYLVVRDLLGGFTNGDSLRLLRDRLDRFPEDLDGFFRHMIDTIPSMYLPFAARIFEVVRLAPEPQIAITFSFIDDVENRPELAIEMEMPIIPMSEPEIDFRQALVRRQLDTRSKGLLEITHEDDFSPEPDLPSNLFNARVDFLHRTVREFLVRSDGLGPFITQHIGNSNTALVMCSAILTTLKKLPPTSMKNIDILTQLLSWATLAEQNTEVKAALYPILESTESFYNSISSPSRSDDSTPGVDFLGYVCLGYACELPVMSYIEEKLRDDRTRAEINKRSEPLLCYALNHHCQNVHPGLVKTLLENGADPNQEIYQSLTIWGRFVRHLKKDGSGRDNETRINKIRITIEILIDYGADLETGIDEGHNTAMGYGQAGKNRALASDVIKTWFTEDEYNALYEKYEAAKPAKPIKPIKPIEAIKVEDRKPKSSIRRRLRNIGTEIRRRILFYAQS
ncbi:hypothetical protein F4813DRAFT_152812 [Daldinia decipiens]|uniref:uncharacterized protein n=1 Tax=Daldinia decipiens TaxID=326647 RepID=UPI0020C2CB98|nr:uncharacterized protein F4813DRAFT_152812 [Daldinia decipiens]KAI1655760.1 hypothetical protein F4813DRAFT_152812 [Daldinia decipiens]